MPRHRLEDVARHYGFELPLAPGALAGLLTTVLRDNAGINVVTLRPACPDCLHEVGCPLKHVGTPCRRYLPGFDVVILDWTPWQLK